MLWRRGSHRAARGFLCENGRKIVSPPIRPRSARRSADPDMRRPFFQGQSFRWEVIRLVWGDAPVASSPSGYGYWHSRGFAPRFPWTARRLRRVRPARFRASIVANFKTHGLYAMTRRPFGLRTAAQQSFLQGKQSRPHAVVQNATWRAGGRQRYSSRGRGSGRSGSSKRR